MEGLFITFEGTEGGGKTTQIQLLTERLRSLGHTVTPVREPGGTVIGEEIRQTLKRSEPGRIMSPETELLLVNASRAQLVREIIRPALARNEIVLCDRFYDSTVAYQGYGRQLDLARVRTVIDLAVGSTRPDLTFLLSLPVETSELRRRNRDAQSAAALDRFEENDRTFFLRVEKGFQAIAKAEPNRVRVVDATVSIQALSDLIWLALEPLLPPAKPRPQ